MSHRPTSGKRRNVNAVPVQLVLFDRDGTLVHDVPYNGDPELVVAVRGARQALDRLRRAGVRVGIVSNQSGIARGLVSDDQVRAVFTRVEAGLGPFDVVEYCPHGESACCGCRKPAPGLVQRAAARLGVGPDRCVVVGDIGADVDAAEAAGARGVLVPNDATRPEEIRRAHHVASDLRAAVDLILAWRADRPRAPRHPSPVGASAGRVR